MVIIQMSGGLGNQMFQYALYRKLCALGRRAFFDDVTAYREEGERARGKHLDVFGITYPVADPADVARLRDAGMSPKDRVRRKLTGRKSREVRDEDFVYDEKLLLLDEVYLTGCFQSARYFADMEEEIREAFTFPEKVRTEDPATEALAARILSAGCNTCSIHLRFGDYLEKKATYGGICTDAYYSAAVDRVRRDHPDTRFFVFSNDAVLAEDWIRREEKRLERETGAGEEELFTLAAGNDEDHGYLDLYLMTLTHDHVIANSSFSWWGAFLGKKPGSLVIAPSLWIRERDGSELLRTDIYTKDMIRISPEGLIADELIGRAPGKAPLVSVIVACYNVAPYVTRAISSLRAQTLRNLEIIAVDDGSTDGTGRILDALSEEDGRIRVLHKENGGLSDCRNAGLAVARGAYIGYLDGDDRADPRMFETMVRGCILTASPMAAVRYREVREENAASGERDGAGEEKSAADLLRDSILMGRKRALDTWITTNIRGPEERISISNSVWSKLFRRDICGGILFDRGRNSEDILYTTKTMLRAGSVLFIPAPLYDYVLDRQGSIMNEKTGERRVRDEIPAWQEHIRLLRDAGLQGLADKAECTLFRRLLYYITDMRREPSLAPWTEELERMLAEHREQVLGLASDPAMGPRGDRERLRLYVSSPAAYWRISALYDRAAAVRRHHE